MGDKFLDTVCVLFVVGVVLVGVLLLVTQLILAFGWLATGLLLVCSGCVLWEASRFLHHDEHVC